MKSMTLLQSSRLAEKDCLVYSQSLANVILECKENDEAMLVKVSSSERNYFVWVPHSSQNSNTVYFCAAFCENIDDMPDVNSGRVIETNEIFCYNGKAYYLHRNRRGKLYIRSLIFLSSQDIAEEIARNDKETENIEDIYLVHMFALGKSKKYLFTAWGVLTERTVEYLPIFEEDWHFFDEYPVTSLLREIVKTGTSFASHGKLYVSGYDKKKKLVLNRVGRMKIQLNDRKQA